MTEFGIILHKDDKERVRAWGRHCSWPPEWVHLPLDVQKFVEGHPSELEEIYQRAFQQKVAEALQELYGINTDEMTLEGLMQHSRETGFWIWWDGKARPPRFAWDWD